MNSRKDLVGALDDYRELRQPKTSSGGAPNARSHSALVSRYYDVVTPFYELGWGTSFHFSPGHVGERLPEAHRRHEEGVGHLLGLRPGVRVADIGCGVGGPLTTIARATGASITGPNNNAQQIARGESMLRKAGLDGHCGFLFADFMQVPLPDGHFDAAYSFEAMCHAPDTGQLFCEIFRLLRPGGEIAAVDWCLTDRFDAGDSRHRDVRERIEFGNATPDLLTTSQQVDAAEAAGFEVLQATDQAATSDPETPWYRSLQGRDFSFSSLARTPLGRSWTAAATRWLERLRVAPEGASEAARLLNTAADALVEGGDSASSRRASWSMGASPRSRSGRHLIRARDGKPPMRVSAQGMTPNPVVSFDPPVKVVDAVQRNDPADGNSAKLTLCLPMDSQ